MPTKSPEFTDEPLEQRRLLAGNDQAFAIDGGDLIIEGDDINNRIAIEASDENPNLFIVRGELGTAINGELPQLRNTEATVERL